MPIAELPGPTPLPGQVHVLPEGTKYSHRSQTLWQLLRFGLVGCLNTLVDLLALNFLLWLLSSQNTLLLLLANSLAYALGALNSFLLNRYWTFQFNGPTNKAEVGRFIATTLAGIACNDLILYVLNSINHPNQFSPVLWTNLTKIVALGCTILISYLGMRLWVFVQSSPDYSGVSRRFGQTYRDNTEAAPVGLQEPAETMPRLTSCSLALVLPVFNEEEIIATTIERAINVLTRLIQDFEIIVVNDGSTDRTGSILSLLSAAEPRVRVITHQQNLGYGATLVDGFAATTKDLTLFMDSDGQFDIQDLGRLLPFIQQYDAVIGYRVKRQDTWMRRFNAWGWKQVVRLVLGIQVRDIDCAFKILHTSFLRDHPLETRGAMINAELLYKLKQAGYTVREIGVRHLPRQGGRATGARLHVILRAFRELFFYARKWRGSEQCPASTSALAGRPSLSASSSSSKGKTMLYTDENSTTAQTSLPDKRLAQPSLWQRLTLIGVLLTSVFTNFYQLGQNGFGNLFYAAGVRSMADSLHNFFFVSYDPGGFVTVDKPPLGFWLQTLSVKLFGFKPFSIFLPQALAGVLAVLLLFHLVRRHFGFNAGLLAALALALNPLSVVTARNNTIDSTLVLTLLAGAWAIMLAVETGTWRWLLLSAALVGLGFNVKMMEAYLIVPAFGLLYLLAAPGPVWPRCGRLLVALLVLLAVSLSWAAVVDLTPASQRPYVGSSKNNSEISLAFGYNGVDRLLGRFGLGGSHARNANQASTSSTDLDAAHDTQPEQNQSNIHGHFDMDSPGPLRLFNQSLGGQISWLLPFALLGVLALAWQRRPRFQKDYQQQSLLLWGAWLVTMGIFFSVAGFFHSYYMTTFAPAICALFGIGVVVMWHDYQRSNWRGWLLPIALIATAAEQMHFIASNPAWGAWLLPLIATACLLTALVLSGARLFPRPLIDTRILAGTLAIGLLALLLTPAIWSATPALQNTAISSPSAGPNRREGFGGFARDNAMANPGLLHYLEEHEEKTTFLVATPSSMSANALILATNKPVMAMGGFAGADPILTPGKLAGLVSQGTVRFFLLNDPKRQTEQAARGNGNGASGFSWFARNNQPALTNWVTQHCALVPATTWQAASTTSTPTAPNSPHLLYDCAPGK